MIVGSVGSGRGLALGSGHASQRIQVHSDHTFGDVPVELPVFVDDVRPKSAADGFPVDTGMAVFQSGIWTGANR